MQILKTDNFAEFQTKHIEIDIVKTFNCGQCFRWEKAEDGYFEGVAFSKYIRVKKEDDKLIFQNVSERDYKEIWHNYFDLDNDYERIQKSFGFDEIILKAANFSKGIHILKQEAFETVISFIISANNNIPRIKKIIELLCRNFGKEIKYKNNTFYAFPKAQDLAILTLKDLDIIRAGFRSKYILDAAIKIFNNEVDLLNISFLPYEEAKNELLKIKGVGDKVADCILLFSFSRYNAFPKDVWIKRIMNNCYGDCECTRFGDYAGIAQQYLYYYGRENKII